MRIQTSQKAELFVGTFRKLFLGVFAVCVCIVVSSLVRPDLTAAATSNTVNFQARLETNAGAIVPDGNYNVEFKLYNVATLGSAEWTEDYTYNSGPGSTDVRLRVANGYLTANLGSITAFPGTINWNQQQWLTMNIGGRVSSGTITWDGEMSPRLQLTALPYAFQAGTLSATSGSNVGTLSFGTITGTDTITLPDASGTVCLQGSSSCNFAPASGSGNYIQNTTSVQSSANFDISGTGIAGQFVAGTLETHVLDTYDSAALAIGNSNATSINLGNTTNNILTTINGTTLLKPTSGHDSTTAFQVQNSSGSPVLSVDTADQYVGIGTSAPTTTLQVNTNNSLQSSPMALLNQAGTGNASLQFATPGQSWTLGINSSNSTLNLTSSTTSTQTQGHTGPGASTDSNDQNSMECGVSFTATYSGTVTSVSVMTGDAAAASPFNSVSMAIYTDSSGVPGTLLASTATGTLSASAGINTLAISASITAGNKYWICANNNSNSGSASNWVYDSVTGNTWYSAAQTFGTWPSTAPGGMSAFTNKAAAMYATYTVGNSFVNSLLNIGTTGQTVFQNSTNSTQAFRIQNTAGASLFVVDTATTVNLISNGDFGSTDGTTGWVAKGSGSTLTQVTTQSWQGNGSLQIATGTTANAGAQYAYTFSASTQYTLSLYAKVASGSITDVNIGRQDNGSNIDCLTGQTISASWTRFSCTFTTGATISGSNIYIIKTSTNAETFFIDGVQLQTGSVATAFNAGGALQLNGVINSPLVVQNKADSTAAFQIQNAAGVALLTADTSNMVVTAAALTLTGNFTLSSGGHVIVTGTTPSIAVNASLCSGTPATASISGSDTSGTITVITGTTCSGSAVLLATITFHTAYASAPGIMVTPLSSQAANQRGYVDDIFTTTTSFQIRSASTATDSATLKWRYWVTQ